MHFSTRKSLISLCLILFGALIFASCNETQSETQEPDTEVSKNEPTASSEGQNQSSDAEENPFTGFEVSKPDELTSYFLPTDDKSPHQSQSSNPEAQGTPIPKELAEAHDLFRFDVCPNCLKEYEWANLQTSYRAERKWSHAGKTVLTYGTHLSNASGDIGGAEIRVLILNEDGSAFKNLLLTGSFAEEGENNGGREMLFTEQGIELVLKFAENIDFLKLPEREVVQF